MEWLITLTAQRADVERLLAESIDGLFGDPDDPRHLKLALWIPDDQPDSTESGDSARSKIQSQLDLLNSLGKLRWGRAFEGVDIAAVRSLDEDGRATQVVFVGTAFDHMLPEDYADMVERLGHPRPPMPKSIEIINEIDLANSMAIAESLPDAVRAVRLVELMLRGDEEINWAAGYAAVEIVKHDLDSRGLDGRDLGWWTKKELGDFKATANSPEVLGLSARHGKPTGLVEARMTTNQASWFVRGIVAQWLASLSDGSRPVTSTT